MSCCGQGRDQTRLPTGTGSTPGPRSLAPQPPGPHVQWGSAMSTSPGRGVVPLRCRDHARLQVRGPVTGKIYAFSSNQSDVMVDAYDAEVLLQTRMFTRTLSPQRV
jgi:hypothetical protein